MRRPVSLVALFLMSASFLSAQAAPTTKSKTTKSTTLYWGPAPAVFPNGATIVSVTAMGPFAMTYVSPADKPQKPAATK